MRVIKFRAWDKDAHNNNMRYFDIDGLCYHNYIVWESMIKHSHPIMQYTGLKDKNGKEIYEGDIINNGYTNQVVEWTKSYDGEPCFSVSSDVEYVVVGNIYENKDLLNEDSIR